MRAPRRGGDRAGRSVRGRRAPAPSDQAQTPEHGRPIFVYAAMARARRARMSSSSGIGDLRLLVLFHRFPQLPLEPVPASDFGAWPHQAGTWYGGHGIAEFARLAFMIKLADIARRASIIGLCRSCHPRASAIRSSASGWVAASTSARFISGIPAIHRTLHGAIHGPRCPSRHSRIGSGRRGIPQAEQAVMLGVESALGKLAERESAILLFVIARCYPKIRRNSRFSTVFCLPSYVLVRYNPRLMLGQLLGWCARLWHERSKN